MPLLPMGPPQGGGLAAPPQGPPQGLMPPPPPMDVPPAGAGALALAPLAQQQQAALDAFKAQQAQEAMAVALQAIGSLPNPVAAAAQTEPGPPMVPPPGQTDEAMQGGGY